MTGFTSHTVGIPEGNGEGSGEEEEEEVVVRLSGANAAVKRLTSLYG